MDLLPTEIQSVQIELIGRRTETVPRFGTVLLYWPLLIIGYALLLVSVMRVIAAVWGWAPTTFMFGLVHLAISSWGLIRGRQLGTSRRYDVVDPVVAPQPIAATRKPSDLRSILPRPSLIVGTGRPLAQRQTSSDSALG